jgi:hypothetical protein
MGQYSKWLHYREIDRQLQAQRDKLERNLHNLQEQARALQAHNLYAPNSIIQALQQQYMHPDSQIPAPSTDAPSSHHSVPEHSTSTALPVVYPRPLQPPLPGTIDHSRYTSPTLPMRTSILKAAQLTPVTARPSATALQLASDTRVIPVRDAPPEALRYTGHARPGNRTLPVDQQSEHTDQMVQRWVERWSKHRQNIQDTHDE